MQLVKCAAPPVDDAVQISERIKIELAEKGSINFSKGMHVIVEYEEGPFPGQITEVTEDRTKVSCIMEL